MRYEDAFSVESIDTTWNIENYRQACDMKSLWNLKKWFMELHKESIEEDELIPLAHAFANVEAFGCTYPPELMERVTELGEPIARVYRNLKKSKCTRTLVSTKAAMASSHENYEDNIEIEPESVELSQMQIARIRPIFPMCSVADLFQNIVVVNNSLRETNEWFERLGGGSITLMMNPLAYSVYDIRIYAANHFIAKAIGPYHTANAQCIAQSLEILKSNCFQVNYKQPFPCLYYNVERLLHESDNVESVGSLKQSNIGYRMLQKLGWTGGPLGHKKTGIVDPIEITIKNDRRGLGCNKITKKKRTAKTEEDGCNIDVEFYEELMKAFLSRTPFYDLIFSPEFTDKELTILAKLATQYRIYYEIRQYETGQVQFVILRYPLSPHEVLTQALKEKNPMVLKFYDVVSPKIGFFPK
ncbi:uncharacterized protein LOC128724000 [Anopheles nili]|uniref:uncharacterized protein LOC128724000 n=1 Tax=Anopheles nili TaxID=185578 RepID=UPI00237BAEE2|nr:uncharacterized protein LOC128724000 [Anopheles nili]